MPNDAVADADVGDAISGAVKEDDITMVTSAASRGGLPNPRPPQLLALQMIEGPKIVRCRWCPSARCAQHDLRRERKSHRPRNHFDAAVARAAVGTTETARASLACSSHRSHRSSRLIASRLVSYRSSIVMVRSVEVRSLSLASAAQDSTYPFEAASRRVLLSHGQPFSRAH